MERAVRGGRRRPVVLLRAGRKDLGRQDRIQIDRRGERIRRPRPARRRGARVSGQPLGALLGGVGPARKRSGSRRGVRREHQRHARRHDLRRAPAGGLPRRRAQRGDRPPHGGKRGRIGAHAHRRRRLFRRRRHAHAARHLHTRQRRPLRFVRTARRGDDTRASGQRPRGSWVPHDIDAAAQRILPPAGGPRRRRPARSGGRRRAGCRTEARARPHGRADAADGPCRPGRSSLLHRRHDRLSGAAAQHARERLRHRRDDGHAAHRARAAAAHRGRLEADGARSRAVHDGARRHRDRRIPAADGRGAANRLPPRIGSRHGRRPRAQHGPNRPRLRGRRSARGCNRIARPLRLERLGPRRKNRGPAVPPRSARQRGRLRPEQRRRVLLRPQRVRHLLGVQLRHQPPVRDGEKAA